LAGLPNDPVLDGVNLIPYLTGKTQGAPHEVLFWRWTSQYAIRKGDWKYITVGGSQYLFNLATDPYEKHDLAAKNSEQVKALRSQLEQWTQTLLPPGLPDLKGGKSSKGSYAYYVDGKPAPTTSPKGTRRGKAKGKSDAGADE
jgi:uncharacterized sulfatase